MSQCCSKFSSRSTKMCFHLALNSPAISPTSYRVCICRILLLLISIIISTFYAQFVMEFWYCNRFCVKQDLLLRFHFCDYFPSPGGQLQQPVIYCCLNSTSQPALWWGGDQDTLDDSQTALRLEYGWVITLTKSMMWDVISHPCFNFNVGLVMDE